MSRLRVALASGDDRETIYRLRHAVYAGELGQHSVNEEGRLRDALDDFNEYVVVREKGEVAGFVSLTPPGRNGYSVDKYFAREDLPFAFDDGLWEVRLLTVPPRHRGRALAFLLMYAAFRLAASRGGTRIVAIGRRELLGLYRKAGLHPLGPRAQAGQVTYELMTAPLSHLRSCAVRFAPLLDRLRGMLDWQLGIPFQEEEACFHGGAFFEAIGETFETLERRDRIVNRETAELRRELVDSLQRALPGVEILEGMANYILCLLPRRGPDATTLCERCRERGVFLRDAGATSAVLGRHALRVAVKDEATNRRVVETVADIASRHRLV